MATKLQTFISEVKTRGMASANKYYVELGVPKGVQLENTRLIALFCDQTQLPDLNINTTPIKTYGEVREVPYETMYGNVNFSFYCDSNLIVKHFFDKWMLLGISNPDTRHFNYYNDYISDKITINMITNDEREVFKVDLFECYPKQMQAVSLDYASREIIKIQVSMNYKYWRSSLLSTSTSASSIQSRNPFNILGNDLESLKGTVTGFLSDKINSIIEIPNDYFNDFGSFQDRIFGDSQEFFSDTADQASSSFTDLKDRVVSFF